MIWDSILITVQFPDPPKNHEVPGEA
jgi:hypothetical protein